MANLPVGDVLRGLTVGELPADWTPLEAILIVQCLNEDGASRWAWRTTADLSTREFIGALVVQLDIARQQAVDEFEE
ncbi:MAG: hypothetical protein QOE93_2020 [Actinomycetota bacterium]|jgi:hypothetical protein|nr:hypothetical protein [Actinomycetota bacterium]